MCSVAIHPTLGIAVRSDGAVCVLDRYTRKFYWSYGADDGSGYMRVKIRNKNYRVHRIILEAFVGECPKGFECDHKDRNRSNNRIENLRWVSRSDNMRNTKANDRVESRGDIHWYEDVKQFCKMRGAEYSKTHRLVRFSNGKSHWLPNEKATELLKLPVSERVWK